METKLMEQCHSVFVKLHTLSAYISTIPSQIHHYPPTPKAVLHNVLLYIFALHRSLVHANAVLTQTKKTHKGEKS
jgi:hypothetical protein